MLGQSRQLSRREVQEIVRPFCGTSSITPDLLQPVTRELAIPYRLTFHPDFHELDGTRNIGDARPKPVRIVPLPPCYERQH